MENKKILIISNPLKEDYGGGERFLENLVNGLNDYEFIFLGRSRYVERFFKSTNRLAVRAFFGFEPVTYKNLILLPISFFASLYQFIRFYKYFKQSDIVLLAAGFTENFTIYPWLRLLNKNVVQIIHSNRCPKAIYRNPLLVLFKMSWNFYNIVFVSNSQMQGWVSKNINPKKHKVIYNGVSVGNNPVACKKSNQIKIGYLGRLHKEKGVGLLINALTKVDLKAGITLLIAGDGPEMSSLKELAINLNIGNINVKFLGFQSEPEKFLQSLDVLVFPSYQEGFSLVLLEAIEKGLPVVLSDLPSFKEVYKLLPDKYQKLIFRKGSVSDSSEKLNYFLNNIKEFESDQNRQQLHNTIKNNFSVSRMLLEYNNLFKKL